MVIGRIARAWLPGWLCALILGGCSATGQAPEKPPAAGIAIEGMLIRNELAYPVTDVMIDVPATGAFAGCGNILPRSECSTSFQHVDYPGHAMVVSWKEYGAPQKTPEFLLKIPAGLDSARPVRLEVVIFAQGQAGATLVQ